MKVSLNKIRNEIARIFPIEVANNLVFCLCVESPRRAARQAMHSYIGYLLSNRLPNELDYAVEVFQRNGWDIPLDVYRAVKDVLVFKFVDTNVNHWNMQEFHKGEWRHKKV